MLLKRNLRHYMGRYLVSASLVFITVCMLCIIVTFNSVYTELLDKSRERLGADLAVVAAGYEGNLESILYDGAIDTLTLSREWEDKLRDFEQINDIASQMYLGTLPGAGCCDGEIQLVAFDPVSDFQITPYLNESCRDLESDEIILGNNFLLKPGDKVTYYNHEFTVVAVMEASGLSLDSAAYISYEALNTLISDARNETLHDLTDMTSVIYVRSDNTSAEILGNIILSRMGRDEIGVVYVDKRLDSLSQTLHEVSIYWTAVLVCMCITNLLGVATLSILTLLSRRAEIGALLTYGLSLTKVHVLYIKELLCVTVLPTLAASALSDIVFVMRRTTGIYCAICGVCSMIACTALSIVCVCVVIRRLIKGHDVVDLTKEVY